MSTEKKNGLKKVLAVGKSSVFESLEFKGLSTKSARAFSSGRAAKLIKFISRLLAFTPARVYGLTFLSFGVLTMFLHLGEYYFMEDPTVAASSLVIGALFSLLSIFLIISDKPICVALQSARAIEFLVFDFLFVNRIQATGSERKLGWAEGVLVGVLLAILGFFLPTEYAVLVIVGLIFFTVSMVSPEFPYIFSLLLFPYISLIPNALLIFAALTVLTLVSFGRKVLIGKRRYSLEIYDILFFIFIITVLICGVILGGDESTDNSLFIMIFALGYIPASNMTVNRRLFDHVAAAMIAASVPSSIYSIIRYLISLAFYERTPSRAFFDSPEILAVYLSVIMVMSGYLAIKRHRIVKKCCYYSAFALSFMAILTTEHFGIPVALLFVLLAVFIVRSRRVSSHFLYLLFTLPMILFFIGDSALSDLSDMLSIDPGLNDRISDIEASLRFLAENLFSGGGADGAGLRPDAAHNVYLGIACRFGVIALFLFLLLIVARIFHVELYKKYYPDSTVNFYVDMTTVAAVAILTFGCYVDVFAEVDMLYFFVSVFAMGSAALRVSRKEKEERNSYYVDLGASDSADVDIILKR